MWVPGGGNVGIELSTHPPQDNSTRLELERNTVIEPSLAYRQTF